MVISSAVFHLALVLGDKYPDLGLVETSDGFVVTVVLKDDVEVPEAKLEALRKVVEFVYVVADRDPPAITIEIKKMD